MDEIFGKIHRMHLTEQETYWDAKHQTLELTDFERSCKMRWDDDASQHLWTRYVYPFEDDSPQLLFHFENTLKQTESLIEHDDKVCNNTFEVDKLSLDIDGLLKRADKEVDNAQRSKEEAVDMRGKCMDARTKIDQYLTEDRSSSTEYSSLYSRRQSLF